MECAICLESIDLVDEAVPIEKDGKPAHAHAGCFVADFLKGKIDSSPIPPYRPITEMQEDEPEVGNHIPGSACGARGPTLDESNLFDAYGYENLDLPEEPKGVFDPRCQWDQK